MDTDDESTYRTLYDPPAETTELRAADDVDEDGMMEIRMAIASSGAVRNEGDDPLTSAELHGMAQQVDSLTRGVFPEHGMSTAVDAERYSQFEKLGYWSGADLQREASDDDEDLLMATARMPDPETLPAATGDYRQGLAILKEQAMRGIPISASIAWRDDENSPGGVDLMEASIVGIGADPRMATEGGEALVARAAVDAGADPDELLETVRAAVTVRDSDADDHRYAAEHGMELSEGPTLSRGELYCGPTDDVYHYGAPQSEMECPGCERVLDGVDMVADLNTDTEQSMTDDDPGDDDAGTDSQEQTADDGETTERAPDDVSLQDFAALLAPSLEDADADALLDAWEGFEYVGSADMDAVAAFVGTVTGNDADAAAAALEDLMDVDDGENEYDEDKDEDEDDDEEQSADTDDDGDESDDDRAAELEERLDTLEDELADVRSGETDVETPGDDGDDESDERGADADGETDDRDPAAKPTWATTN